MSGDARLPRYMGAFVVVVVVAIIVTHYQSPVEPKPPSPLPVSDEK